MFGHSRDSEIQVSFSRRSFFQAAGAGAVGSLLVPWVSGRGLEALTLDAFTGTPERPLVPGPIRLNSNENPNGPGKIALDALVESLSEANRYPHAAPDGLKAALASAFGVSVANVQLGCGSSDILRAAVYAFTGPGRALVTCSPSYESPPSDAKRVGAPVIEVAVTGDLKLDLDAMATAARGAGLVYLCNPNNPTSTVHGAQAIAGFVARVLKDSPQTTVLIDEAYHEYVDDPAYATALPLAMENPRVIVARTFSKVYGMAGMRIGYALGDAQTMRALGTQTLSLGVNHLAAAAALAGLGARPHIERERVLNREARAYTLRELANAGYPAADSQANFVMVNLRRDAQPVREACRTNGVLVGRAFPPLGGYCRISIGTMDEMRQGMDVFKRALAAV
jgi:histidinol-phosphate aminotransferase